MKTIQRAIRIMMCGLGAVAVTQTASAEADAGFYLGVSAGESTYRDLDQDEFDGIVLDAFFSQGFPVTSGSSKLEDSDTTLSLVAGYRFNPYIAVEASYVDLGTAEYRSVGTVNPPGPITSLPATLDLDIESKGVGIAALGSLPLGNIFDLHARLGLFIADTELSASSTLGTASGTESDSLDSQNVFAGVGAAFHIGSHVSLSLDWIRYADLGDDNDFYEDEDEDEDEGGIDVDALTLSAMFRF